MGPSDVVGLSYVVGSVRAVDATILLDVQSGLMKGYHSVIDYSMQCGSFDVGVSVLAACWFSACSVVPAFVVAAFPFLPCGLALSAELRLYPVFCFQSWISMVILITGVWKQCSTGLFRVILGPWIVAAGSRVMFFLA